MFAELRHIKCFGSPSLTENIIMYIQLEMEVTENMHILCPSEAYLSLVVFW